MSHARRICSVRRTRIASAAVATRKTSAQIAEAVLLVRFAPSAKRSRRDAVPRAHLARSRPAQELSPVVHAWLAATLAHIKATAQQAQGLWSVQIAHRLRGFIAQRVPRTGAHLQGQPAQLGISVCVECLIVTGVPETSRFVPSVRDGTVPPKPSQPTAPNAPLDTTARERQPARRPVCAGGTASAVEGATSIATCAYCQAGTSAPVGSSVCSLCEPGTVSSTLG